MKYVCSDCIYDDDVKDDLLLTENAVLCSFCGNHGEAYLLSELSQYVRGILLEDYMLTSSVPQGYDTLPASEGEWNRPGEMITFVISEIAGIEEEVAKEIRQHLSNYYCYEDREDEAAENPYDEFAMYESKYSSLGDHDLLWDDFKEIIHTSPDEILPEEGSNILERLFYEVDDLKTYYLDPVVKVLNPEENRVALFRARQATNDEMLNHIIGNPTENLGPPPEQYASPGRMNAEGVPVFYGAFDRQTCLDEIRHFRGNSAVVGQFELIREVRLLDFKAVLDVFNPEERPFDSGARIEKQMNSFLHNMVSELCKPVQAGEEETEYRPTQAICEYLNKFHPQRFDGIMYPSARNELGTNIVLFHNAALVYSASSGNDSREVALRFVEGSCRISNVNSEE